MANLERVKNLPTKKLTKIEKLSEFKSKQYKDLIDDYDNMSKSIDNMAKVIDNALEKLENNIKDEDDSKVSAKVNALSTLVYTSLKLQEHKMDLHNNFDELIDAIIPDDVITVVNDDIKDKKENTDIVDPLAGISKRKRA